MIFFAFTNTTDNFYGDDHPASTSQRHHLSHSQDTGGGSFLTQGGGGGLTQQGHSQHHQQGGAFSQGLSQHDFSLRSTAATDMLSQDSTYQGERFNSQYAA